MHPHVLALPYALMALALAFNLFRMGQTQSDGWRRGFWGSAPIALFYPVFLGALSFLNTWDFPIHVFIVALAWGLGRLHGPRLETGPRARTVWTDSLTALVACGVIGVLVYLPFYIGFRSQAAGVVPNIYNPTRWPQFVVMFGPFLLIGAAFVLTLIVRAVRQRRLTAVQAALASVAGGAGIVIAAAALTAAATLAVLAISGAARAKLDEWSSIAGQQGFSLSQVVVERVTEVSVPLLLGVSMAAIVLVLRNRGRPAGDAEDHEEPTPFVLILFFVGALLTFAVEYVFLLDFFGTRMNTVFKLYYQSWALWGVGSAYAVYYLWQSSQRLTGAARAAFAAVVAACVAGGLVYPALAIPDKIDRNIVPTLDAREPARQFAPDEVAAIEWLERNATGRPVILEAVGQDYRDGTSRVSAWTGLPSVLGWDGHEGQWRGTYADISPRQPDIDKIYSTTDPAAALALMQKYQIEYVYVGPNEIGKYPASGLAKFDTLMDLVFEQGQSKVYQRRLPPAF
jgi:YYY domain-containing protein